jgi:flagellar hook protein FlgE
MAGELSTIQSLKAVDQWIDVINANINGGVRTGFKSSRLKFGGSNVDITRAGTTSSLPLQFPEPGLTTANTVIDFGQGAVTASTETTHLAIQGEGFFGICQSITASGAPVFAATNKVFLTRDGEFRTNQDGLLVNNAGYFLVAFLPFGAGFTPARAVYNDLDLPVPATTFTGAMRLSDYLKVTTATTDLNSGGVAFGFQLLPLLNVVSGKQSLSYTQFGSTVYDFGFTNLTGAYNPNMQIVASTASDATVLSKSLEASNASMTQSVPELSLAQKLFSALTKVLQTKQTNIDGVLNLVR